MLSYDVIYNLPENTNISGSKKEQLLKKELNDIRFKKMCKICAFQNDANMYLLQLKSFIFDRLNDKDLTQELIWFADELNKISVQI